MNMCSRRAKQRKIDTPRFIDEQSGSCSTLNYSPVMFLPVRESAPTGEIPTVHPLSSPFLVSVIANEQNQNDQDRQPPAQADARPDTASVDPTILRDSVSPVEGHGGSRAHHGDGWAAHTLRSGLRRFTSVGRTRSRAGS